jgi:hypothetical protein
MRQYATDSPEAMARIIALSMLVDGGLDKSELDVMVRYGVLARLGMSDADFEKIVHLLCEDMLQCVPGIHHGQIELDDDSIDGILQEVQDSRLRKTLLKIMLAVVDADQRLSDGEAILISRAMEQWELDLIEVSNLVYASASQSYDTEQQAYVLRHPKNVSSQTSVSTPSILETHF